MLSNSPRWQRRPARAWLRSLIVLTVLLSLLCAGAVPGHATASTGPIPIERGYGFGIGTPYGGAGFRGAYALAPRLVAEAGVGVSIWDLGGTVDSSPLGLAIGLAWQNTDLSRPLRSRFSAFWGQNQWRRVYTYHGPTRLAASGLVFGPGVGLRVSEQWRLDLDVFYALRNKSTLAARDHSQAVLVALGMNRRWLGKGERKGDVR
jgi:hypothetical protein